MAAPSKPKSRGPSTSTTYSAPALEKGFNVIELLARSPQGLTASEIAAGLGQTISEIFRIIIVMERRQWLNKNPETDKYTVSSKVLELAFRATPADELTLVAGPHMRELAEKLDQSCHLVMPNGHHGLVILRQENPGPTVFAVRLGSNLDLARTCSGSVLLAFGDDEWVEETLDADANLAPQDRAALINRLKLVRSRGFEMRPSARTYGVTDISFPIFGFGGRIAAALTIPFMIRIDGTQIRDEDAAREELAATAKRISIDLGWFERDEQAAPTNNQAESTPPRKRPRKLTPVE